MSKLPRACLRCIERKRKCDHVRPECGTCVRASVSCAYPEPQQRRSGPLSGFSKTAEDRAVAAEDALAWLLSREEVQVLLRSFDGTTVIPQSQDKGMSKESRVEYWTNRPLETIADLCAYATSSSVTSERTTGEIHSRSQDREEERGREREREQGVQRDATDSEDDDEEIADPHAMNPNHPIPPIPHPFVSPIHDGMNYSPPLILEQDDVIRHADNSFRNTSPHQYASHPHAVFRAAHPYPRNQPVPHSPARNPETPLIPQNPTSSLDASATWTDGQATHQRHQHYHETPLPPNPTPLDALATWAGRLPLAPRPESVDTRQVVSGATAIEGYLHSAMGRREAELKKPAVDLFW